MVIVYYNCLIILVNVKNILVENKVDCKLLKINKWVFDVVMFLNINMVLGYGYCKMLYCLIVVLYIVLLCYYNFI